MNSDINTGNNTGNNTGINTAMGQKSPSFGGMDQNHVLAAASDSVRGMASRAVETILDGAERQQVTRTEDDLDRRIPLHEGRDGGGTALRGDRHLDLRAGCAGAG